MTVIGRDIQVAMQILSGGELVAIPTETVYGLAANALNVDAVIKIFDVKNRPSFDPLIVHIGTIETLENLVNTIPEKAEKLAEAFWPGPLTLLLPKKAVIPDLVTAGLPTVGVRMPNHELTLELLRAVSFPLAAPSANPFGYVSPTAAMHVNDQLGNKIPYILDGGLCDIGIESTIIGFGDGGLPTIHRLGGKTVEDIEEIVGTVDIRKHSTSRPTAPGMLQSHYAPGKKVYLGTWNIYSNVLDKNKAALITFKKIHPDFDPSRQVVLSEDGDMRTAAKNLFAALRKFDRKDINYIVAELLPEKGLGRAINDRLRRAASED